MSKAYHEMTSAERIADRIARNRRIEEATFSGVSGLSLQGIVARLDAHKQRATYGAVAELVGVLPRSHERAHEKLRVLVDRRCYEQPRLPPGVAYWIFEEPDSSGLLPPNSRRRRQYCRYRRGTQTVD